MNRLQLRFHDKSIFFRNEVKNITYFDEKNDNFFPLMHVSPTSQAYTLSFPEQSDENLKRPHLVKSDSRAVILSEAKDLKLPRSVKSEE
jgi:hypothetical protein